MDNDPWTQVRFHTTEVLSIASALTDERETEEELRTQLTELKQQLRTLQKEMDKLKRRLRHDNRGYENTDVRDGQAISDREAAINATTQALAASKVDRKAMRKQIKQARTAYEAQHTITSALKAEMQENKGLLVPLLENYNQMEWEFVTVMSCADVKALKYIMALPHHHQLKFTLGLSLTETNISPIRKLLWNEFGNQEFTSETLYRLRDQQITMLTREQCIAIGFIRPAQG